MQGISCQKNIDCPDTGKISPANPFVNSPPTPPPPHKKSSSEGEGMVGVGVGEGEGREEG